MNQVVILPVFSPSTNSPREMVLALRNPELKDEDLGKIGIQISEIADVNTEELYKLSQQIIQSGKFLVTVGDEPAITSSLVKVQLEKWPSMKLLEMDAQALNQAGSDAQWFVKVVDDLPEHVYFSIHIDGMNQNESRHIIDLTRELTHRRNVIGLDLIGFCKDGDQALLCAKLIHQIVSLIFHR